MILSDAEITRRVYGGDIVIEPFDAGHIEPASVDLRLDDTHHVVRRGGTSFVDTRDENTLSHTEKEGELFIQPDTFVLASTMERVEIPHDVVAHVIGRSTLGRLGISVHQTAGFIDPGFEGQITLELANHGPSTVKLYPGQRICQIVFTELNESADRPYGHDGSQYQHQYGATPSRMSFD